MIKRALIALSMFFFFTTVTAAEVTEVADSFDTQNPFDFNFNILYNNMHNFGNIKREYNSIGSANTAGKRVEVLEYSGDPHLNYYSEILLSAEIGIYHDLSISFFLPIVIGDNYTLYREDGDRSDDSDLGDIPKDYNLVENGFFPSGDLSYKHTGVGDFGLSLQWALYNQERNRDAFSWLYGLKITFPTASLATPAGMNENSSAGKPLVSGEKGKVGSGLYIFNLRTAVSRRHGFTEPYFQIDFNLPAKSGDTIYKDPRKDFGFNMGAEFIPWERKKRAQKISLRTDLGFRYFTRGNAYNSITDARWVYSDTAPAGAAGWESGENLLRHILPIEDPFVQALFTFKANFRIHKYVKFGGFASGGYQQKHYLTAAIDNSEDGYVPGLDDEKTAAADKTSDDAKRGGRLIMERNILFGWGFNLTLLF